jgi:hypothetical protein
MRVTGWPAGVVHNRAPPAELVENPIDGATCQSETSPRHHSHAACTAPSSEYGNLACDGDQGDLVG